MPNKFDPEIHNRTIFFYKRQNPIIAVLRLGLTQIQCTFIGMKLNNLEHVVAIGSYQHISERAMDYLRMIPSVKFVVAFGDVSWAKSSHFIYFDPKL